MEKVYLQMNHKNSKLKYREWIKRRSKSLHRISYTDRHEDKNWKENLTALRERIIDQYIEEGFTPKYMVTRNYWYHQGNRKAVINHNKRVNIVIDDLYNHKGIKDRYIGKDHFMERHDDKLVEDAKGRWWIKTGGFHVHTLLTNIDTELLLKPSPKMRKTQERIYGTKFIDLHELTSQSLQEEKIKELLDNSLRHRCGFIGNGKKSLDVVITNDKYKYDGYEGWKGLVAYVTKQMYRNEKIIEIYDQENSTTLLSKRSKNENYTPKKNRRKDTKMESIICV